MLHPGVLSGGIGTLLRVGLSRRSAPVHGWRLSRSDCCHPEDKSVTCAEGACGLKTNNCGQSVQCLHQAGDPCVQDGDCCSNVCVTDSNGLNGVCQAGKVGAGDACDANSDCASGHCCGLVCRDLTSDPTNCGSCGAVCPNDGMQTITCGESVCNGVCAPGFADCNNDKLLDGCEVNLTNDPANCGSCGYPCFPGQLCQSSACVCPDGQKLCGTDCIPNDHCCVNTDCLTGQLCQSGACVCPVNQTLCGAGSFKPINAASTPIAVTETSAPMTSAISERTRVQIPPPSARSTRPTRATHAGQRFARTQPLVARA